MKNLPIKHAAVLAALFLFGCASVKYQKTGDNSYDISCSSWKIACTHQADSLCGTDHYKVILDSVTMSCAGQYGSSAPCRWETKVECIKP